MDSKPSTASSMVLDKARALRASTRCIAEFIPSTVSPAVATLVLAGEDMDSTKYPIASGDSITALRTETMSGRNEDRWMVGLNRRTFCFP